jgi:S-methylmethionine-dependent homocysteine/selenocysteine methylase
VAVTILDGPLGTELLARGVPTPLPGWSAHAIDSAPAVIASIHADYAAAGATVHTANTFRTKRRTFPRDWQRLARRAVDLCRGAVPPGHRVAGSVAPLEDCYRPGLSPADPRPEHRELALVLAGAGCDILLCETFPHIGEALIAVEECVAAGVETWVSFTAGPRTDLLTPSQVAAGALEAALRGATAALVNCVPAARTLEYVEALAEVGARTGLAAGAYANAGAPDEGMGWRSEPGAPERYADLAEQWARAGATIIGGCCGTGVGHVKALAIHMMRTHGPRGRPTQGT